MRAWGGLGKAARPLNPLLTVCEDWQRVKRMNPTDTSIFDLSPSEKLQLVGDLWEDLAVTPEAVPIHDWQKEELARRKANLAKRPGSGVRWEQVKERVHSRRDR